MKNILLKSFPDAYRQSMMLYAERLAGALQPVLGAHDQAVLYEPKRVFLSPSLLRYWAQYADYSLQTFFMKGDIFHITDHVYSHLLHTFDSSKAVVTFHDAIGFDKQETGDYNFLKKYVRNWNMTGLLRAARIICVSQTSRRRLLELLNYPEDRIRVIYSGVEESFFKSFPKTEARKELGLTADCFYILHTGHTKDHKNIPALFHVLSLLKKRADFKIKLLKTGMPFTPEQNQLILKLGLEHDIVHLGLLARENLPKVYRAADVLLVPSFDEGFGFPVIEAMAAGLPVTASNCGSLPEVIGNAGLLKNPENYQDFAQDIYSILTQDSLRLGLIRKGLERARQFRWQETARRTLEVYQEIYLERLKTK